MVSKASSREVLRGVEGRIFDLLSKTLKPEQWAAFLKTPLERAAAQGDIGLVDKLVEAGGRG